MDEEFELIKKEFKENGTEYRWTSKEIINTSLKNNPLLKNYEEIYKHSDNNNDSFLQNKKNDEIYKRITMSNNRILNDVKNLSIYNEIYPNKRKVIDVIKIIPENKRKLKEKNIEPFFYEVENEKTFTNNKELNNINCFNEKENNNNMYYNTFSKPLLLKNKEKTKNNVFKFKSPDKTKKGNNGKKDQSKINTSNYKVNCTNNLRKDRNKNNEKNLFFKLKDSPKKD